MLSSRVNQARGTSSDESVWSGPIGLGWRFRLHSSLNEVVRGGVPDDLYDRESSEGQDKEENENHLEITVIGVERTTKEIHIGETEFPDQGDLMDGEDLRWDLSIDQ